MFYNDHSSFNHLLEMMQSERERSDESSALLYHIHLVKLLASCTEGKNVYTEIKCHSLLPLDDIVRIVTHPDCVPEVRETQFVNPVQNRSVDTSWILCRALVVFCTLLNRLLLNRLNRGEF